MKTKKGFTIIELMMVMAVIAVLMGIITTAVSSSIRASRKQRANALCSLVESGLATYREQNGKWPISLLNQDVLSPRDNHEGPGGKTDPDKIVLTGTEVRQCVLEMVKETKNNRPVMDISGLFVSRFDGELNGGSGGSNDKLANNNSQSKIKPSSGLDFMMAIRGTKRSPKKMSTSEMYFGYPDPETGYFLRFKMVYSIPTDHITVSKQRE